MREGRRRGGGGVIVYIMDIVYFDIGHGYVDVIGV